MNELDLFKECPQRDVRGHTLIRELYLFEECPQLWAKKPKMVMQLATVVLKNGPQKRLRGGHPWVYRTEIENITGAFEPGEIVDVLDARNKFVGRGYINPASMLTVRLLTTQNENITEEFIVRRVKEAWAYRQKLLDENSDSCRVIFGEADFLPGLIVDKFGPYLVVQTLTLGIDRWREAIIQTLDEIVNPEGIYERNDAAVRELEGLELRKGYIKGSFPTLVTIKENGLKLYVDIEKGQKTGYFLDQRENRAAVRDYVKDKRVLDCFCHTGSFALHSAYFGAKEVLGLDISEEAVAMATRNALLNGLESRCSFQVGNTFDVLREMDKDKQKFDTIILDPPAFTKSKSAVKGALRGYKEINLRAMHLLPEHGILITNSCSYHMTEGLFQEVIHEAAQDARRQVRLIELRRQAKDHPMLLGYDESYYLKCFILEVI